MMGNVLAYRSCHNKLPQSWFKTTETYSLSVLQATSPNQGATRTVLSEGSKGGSFLALLTPRVAGISWFIDVSLQSLPLSSHGLLSECVYLPSLSYQNMSHDGFRAHPTPG